MADAGRAPSSRRVQILCRAGRIGDRAGPHRHRPAERLRQIQSRRGAALGDGPSLAEAATGPRSGALVGQGRIGALIAAKPIERRLLLDEAAGTAGLHARRHEAELKLKATEDNLGRLDDVIVALAAQVETLKKQVRQAQRYRRLGEQIRRTEAQLLHARWRTAAAESEAGAGEARASEP